MEERIPAGPAVTESARERAWTDFVVSKRDPDVAPLVLDSWVRSRDVFHVDPALKRSPLVLPEDERRRRSERLEALRVSAPVLERLDQGTRDQEGAVQGPPRTRAVGEAQAVLPAVAPARR